MDDAKGQGARSRRLRVLARLRYAKREVGMAELWNADEAASIAAAIFLKPGVRRDPIPLPASPRGNLPNGMADFRSFPLHEAAWVSMDGADWSGARAPKNRTGAQETIQLRDLNASRCVFDRAGKFHRITGQFTGCSFRKITTMRAHVAGTFTDCDFSGANFRSAHFDARFVRCQFHGCNLHLASWPSTFEDCEFRDADIHPIFQDIRDAAFASDRVTFKVTMSKVIVGDAA